MRIACRAAARFLAPLAEAVRMLWDLKTFELVIGSDGRSRFLVFPFGALTGRCTPRQDNSFWRSLLGLADSLLRCQGGLSLTSTPLQRKSSLPQSSTVIRTCLPIIAAATCIPT